MSSLTKWIVGFFVSFTLSLGAWSYNKITEHEGLIHAHGAVQQLILESLKRIEDRLNR